MIVLILALDTSTAACSAALRQNGSTVSKSIDYIERGHAEVLIPMIEKMMKKTGHDPKAIELIAVTIGPGAFTGLRVGLATARGISLATGAPCIGLTSTETLAAALVKDELNESILAVITSKRTDIYSQAFKANNVPISEPSALALEKLSDYYKAYCCTDNYFTLVGDAQGIVAPHLIEAGWKVKKSSIISPDAETLAGLAEARWKPDTCYLPPTPLYLRPADAIIPKNSGRLRS